MRFVLIAVLLAIPIPLWAGPLEAGAASVDITPPLGHPLWGYAARRDAPSTRVQDPLLARALVLSSGGRSIALVSLDLGRAPTRGTTAAIRERARSQSGVDAMFLVASHTHHGPVLELDDWPSRERPYVKELEQKLGDVIAAAARACRPAKLGIAARETRLNRNRHSRRADAPVDRELVILRVEDLEGKVIAHAVNFAAHATLEDSSSRAISADFPGVLARRVEQETGVPCLFLQGAEGDLSPNPPGARTPAAFGEALAREVLEQPVACQAMDSPRLEVRQDEFRFSPRINLGNALVRSAVSAAFFPELVAYYDREYREGVRPNLTTALLDGRIGFVGVSGEFFCGHALSLRRRARLDALFFLGCCNDYQQYFPTIEGAAEGGYGTEPWIAPAEIGAGERVIDRALIHLLEMRGKR